MCFLHEVSAVMPVHLGDWNFAQSQVWLDDNSHTAHRVLFTPFDYHFMLRCQKEKPETAYKKVAAHLTEATELYPLKLFWK